MTAGTAHVTLGYYGGGFGNHVQVQVGDLWVRYAYLEAVLVNDGDQVAPGTVLRLEGSMGFSTGPHLHFQVDRGVSGGDVLDRSGGADLDVGCSRARSGEEAARVDSRFTVAGPGPGEHRPPHMIRQVSATVEVLLEQLSEVGWPVRIMAELANTRRQYPEAVPVLTAWLDSLDATDIRRLPRDVEMAVRALAVPAARSSAAPCLINLFTLVPESSTSDLLRWAVGNTLGVVADESVADEMVTLATDRRYGTARQMIVLGLGRLPSNSAEQVLIDLLEDDQVADHAIMALGRRRATRAVAAITPLLRHPKPWVRNEAVKALRRIQAQTSTDHP